MRRDVMLIGDLGDLGDFADILESTDDRGIIVPMLEPPKGPAMAIPEPERASKFGGWPPPAKPVKEAWLADGRYRVQRGDTVSGLAKTYLGAYERWREIWNVQTAEFRSTHPTADKIRVGDVMGMPKDAQANARARGFLGIGKGAKTALWIAGISTGVAAIGSAAYYAWGR